MPLHRPVAVALALICTAAIGVAAPAGAVGVAASPRAGGSGRSAVAAPTCYVAGVESIAGVMFVNNQFTNGTWTYATGVACTSAVADIALVQQLYYQGRLVDSKGKGFTGVSRPSDAIASRYFCAVCNGAWTFIWAEIVKAPSGSLFATAPAGCVVLQNGLYLECVQTKTVTL